MCDRRDGYITAAAWARGALMGQVQEKSLNVIPPIISVGSDWTEVACPRKGNIKVAAERRIALEIRIALLASELIQHAVFAVHECSLRPGAHMPQDTGELRVLARFQAKTAL